uniref:Uncharacterized protein n=1 Tax=Actinoplanes garbadinensis TaxID=69485 RepID=C4NFG2_ACTGA|nr:hypothetical protein [Actinoplanes garbadinensis]
MPRRSTRCSPACRPGAADQPDPGRACRPDCGRADRSGSGRACRPDCGRADRSGADRPSAAALVSGMPRRTGVGGAPGRLIEARAVLPELIGAARDRRASCVEQRVRSLTACRACACRRAAAPAAPRTPPRPSAAPAPGSDAGGRCG